MHKNAKCFHNIIHVHDRLNRFIDMFKIYMPLYGHLDVCLCAMCVIFVIHLATLFATIPSEFLHIVSSFVVLLFCICLHVFYLLTWRIANASRLCLFAHHLSPHMCVKKAFLLNKEANRMPERSDIRKRYLICIKDSYNVDYISKLLV